MTRLDTGVEHRDQRPLPQGTVAHRRQADDATAVLVREDARVEPELADPEAVGAAFARLALVVQLGPRGHAERDLGGAEARRGVVVLAGPQAVSQHVDGTAVDRVDHRDIVEGGRRRRDERRELPRGLRPHHHAVRHERIGGNARGQRPAGHRRRDGRKDGAEVVHAASWDIGNVPDHEARATNGAQRCAGRPESQASRCN